MCDHPSSEHYSRLHLVTFHQKLSQVLCLKFNIVFIGIRVKTNFLYVHYRLVLFCQLFLFLSLVIKLTVIDYLAYRRLRIWGNLYKIKTPCLSYSQRSEEHTSELQSRENLVCRLLLEKKKKINKD